MLNLKKNWLNNFFEFLHPLKNQSWSMAAILNFSKTLKKSPADLHTMGNVIVKFEKFLTSSFIVFAPTKFFRVALWRPFWILVASLKNHLHIPMLLRMSCENFKKIWPVVFEFLRPQENVTPDRIMARLKSPFPYGRGIKTVRQAWCLGNVSVLACRDRHQLISGSSPKGQ